jgi:hypothetical protein
MHAQPMDEVQNFQTSSIRNSFIKCPIRECRTIPESSHRAPQRPWNQKVKKVNPKKSDLMVNPRNSTSDVYISQSTNFSNILSTPLDSQALRMEGRSSQNLKNQKSKILNPNNLENLETLTLSPLKPRSTQVIPQLSPKWCMVFRVLLHHWNRKHRKWGVGAIKIVIVKSAIPKRWPCNPKF